MLEREWLLGVASAERVALGRTIQYTPPEFWEGPSPAEGWRVRDVVAHLAASEVAAAAAIAGEAATEIDEFTKGLPTGQPFTRDAFDTAALARRAEEPVVSVALEWGRAADLLLSRASKLTDEDWTGREVNWMGEDLKTGYLLQGRVAEWWIHGEDLRAGGGLPPRREDPPIRVVCDLAVRLMPYAAAAAGIDGHGKSVLIELSAVGEGTWHQALHAGETVPEKKQPDAVIRGQAHVFALLAAGRADVEIELYDGILNTGGDKELGEALLRNLRATI